MPTLLPLDSSLLQDLFSMQIPLVDKVVRTVAVYLALAVILRLMGKRLMAQMNSLDLVVVLLLSNVVQNAIIGADNSLLGGLVGAVVLVAFNAGLDRIAAKSSKVRWLIEGVGTTVVKDGEVQDGALDHLGMSELELDTALRQQGADSVREVADARIEPGGMVTVTLKSGDQAASRDDLAAAVEMLRAEIASLRASAH